MFKFIILCMIFQVLIHPVDPFSVHCVLDRSLCRNNELDNSASNLEKQQSNLPKLLPSACGLRPAMVVERIVGGSEAQFGQFPWQAQIHVYKSKGRLSFQCGGTLIKDDVIVTAAHCIRSPDPSEYVVILGKHTSDITPVCDEQRFIVSKLVVHKGFDSRVLTHDIALMWLETKYGQPVQFTDYIQPACLPSLDDDDLYLAGFYGHVSGWGLTNETDANSAAQRLQHVSVPILHSEHCVRAYKNLIKIDPTIQFCAGNDKNEDACSGDSGGPFVKERNGIYTLIGVVSFGKGCARTAFPGVYVKVQGFLSWIEQQLTKDTSNPATISTTLPASTATTTQSTTTTTEMTTSTTPPPTTTIIPESSSQKDEIKIFTSTGEGGAAHSQVGPVCQGHFKHLSCPSNFILNIIEVFYGRIDERYCKGVTDANFRPCRQENAAHFLYRQCQGKPFCWIYHSLFYIDPCPGVDKYLFILYDCVGINVP